MRFLELAGKTEAIVLKGQNSKVGLIKLYGIELKNYLRILIFQGFQTNEMLSRFLMLVTLLKYMRFINNLTLKFLKEKGKDEMISRILRWVLMRCTMLLVQIVR